MNELHLVWKNFGVFVEAKIYLQESGLRFSPKYYIPGVTDFQVPHTDHPGANLFQKFGRSIKILSSLKILH